MSKATGQPHLIPAVKIPQDQKHMVMNEDLDEWSAEEQCILEEKFVKLEIIWRQT